MLSQESTVAFFATVQQEDERQVERKLLITTST
jgi:hypothetical protein